MTSQQQLQANTVLMVNPQLTAYPVLDNSAANPQPSNKTQLNQAQPYGQAQNTSKQDPNRHVTDDKPNDDNILIRRYDWYKNLDKPSITPPVWAFPVVWTIVYALIAISLYFYLKETHFMYHISWIFFAIQIILNFLWTPLFFCFRMVTVAMIDIILMEIFIILNIIYFYPGSPLAAYLLIPYAVWVGIATYLNVYIFFKNPDPCCGTNAKVQNSAGK